VLTTKSEKKNKNVSKYLYACNTPHAFLFSFSFFVTQALRRKLRKWLKASTTICLTLTRTPSQTPLPGLWSMRRTCNSRVHYTTWVLRGREWKGCAFVHVLRRSLDSCEWRAAHACVLLLLCWCNEKNSVSLPHMRVLCYHAHLAHQRCDTRLAVGAECAARSE